MLNFVLKMGQTNHNPISFHYVSFWCLCGHARNLANSPSSWGMVLKRLMDSHGMGWMTITHASIYIYIYISYQIDSIIFHMMFQWYSHDGEIPWRCHGKKPIISDMLDVENPWFSKENRPQMDTTIYNLLDFPHLWDSFPRAIHGAPYGGALRQVRSPVSPASPGSPWPCGSTAAAAMRCYSDISAGRRHWSTGRLGLDGTG